jgi:hypothetical protein
MNGRRRFTRYLVLSTFLFSTLLFGDKHPRLILLFASRASPVDSYGGYARGYCSGLLLGLRSANEWKHGATRSAVASEQPSNLTLRDFVAAIAGLFLRRLCFPSIFHTLDFVIMRDHASSLRDITLRCCERSRFIIMRDYASVLLSLHSYLNYTTRRNILP